MFGKPKPVGSGNLAKAIEVLDKKKQMKSVITTL
jgi:hypothetical protein